MISEKENVWPNRSVTEVLTTHDLGKRECVAIWPGDGVLNTHDLGKGECVAMWPGDGVLTTHYIEKRDCVAINSTTIDRSRLPLIREGECDCMPGDRVLTDMISTKEYVWPYGPVTEYLLPMISEKGDCVAMNSTSDDVLTAHDIGKGECVAIWPVDESLDCHDSGKRMCGHMAR
ncbi:hypothetical protein BgiBS90_038324 [Biomphalaria glabrata]|nr:hypothetical protein BgiBS90_038324 [Biomphalaria glabrata]